MHAYIIQKEGFLAVADTNLSFAHTSRAMWELCVWVCWWVGGGCGCVFLTFGKARVRGVPTRTHQWQKRPTKVSKETYYSVKRDLLKCQKRPTIETWHGFVVLERLLQGADVERLVAVGVKASGNNGNREL